MLTYFKIFILFTLPGSKQICMSCRGPYVQIESLPGTASYPLLYRKYIRASRWSFCATSVIKSRGSPLYLYLFYLDDVSAILEAKLQETILHELGPENRMLMWPE